MLDIYYEIYLMYMRMNDTYKASVYKNKIISTFPESSYAIALSDPNYIEKLRNMDKLQEELYAETYQCYLDGNTSKVHANYEFVKANWPLSKLMPKFMFLDALSYVPENRVGEFKTTLEQLTATYCESDVAPLAGLMIKGLAEGRNLEGGGMMRGMIWDTKFAFEGSAFGGDSIMNSFTDNKDVPHLFVLAFRTDSVNSNNILFDIAKYNFSNYLVKDFDLETITFNELSMIVIKGFDRFDELVKYRKGFSSAKGVLLPACITPVMISDDNFRLRFRVDHLLNTFPLWKKTQLRMLKNLR